MIEVLLPVQTLSEANLRGHWAKRFRRASSQRETARVAVKAALNPRRPQATYLITLTRIASRDLDTDNLASALKAVRDGVADALGVNDGDPRLEWRYAQRKAKPREYAVKVEIR